ncbi:Major Facilitator Superfamily protein [Micromonospora citrea]|uniref:Major Facilitator Superfamily protein n=1 Tax=Micromonospora citrea TaxID=47855 RepID=A0A1C6VD00_9ACTN|nr:MFS transporter [Micromonospora citrea]SCL64271.1 Major Facilitator Superfamily protein [Micromonospora citrea]
MSRRSAYGLLVAQAVSVTGTRMSVVAVPWFVLETTGDALLTGVTAFVEMGALVAARILGGPLVDRIGPRVASVGGDLIAGLVLGVVPLLYAAGLLAYPVLLVLVGLVGLFRGPSDNAKYAMVPDVAATAGWSNERAAGLADSVHRLGSLVGAPLGAVLIALVGAPAVIALDAATFLLAGALVATLVRVRRVEPEPAEAGHTGVRGYLADLGAGLRFVRRDPLLRAIVAMVLLTNLLDQAMTAVLVPVWAAERFDDAAPVGLVFGALSAGALVGSLLVSMYGARLPRWRTYTVAFLLGAVPRIFVLALPVGLPVIAGVGFAGGVLIGAINPLLSAAEFERIPAELRARVLGAVGGLAWAGIPLGGLVGGVLATTLGPTGGILVVGAAYLLVTLDPLVRRRTWRLMDRPAPAPAPVSVPA